MDDDIRTGRNSLIVEMEVGQFFAILVEVNKVVHILHDGDAWERFFQVCSKPLTVIGGMQDAIDIVENHLFGYVPGTTITTAHLFEDPVGDAITTNVFALGLVVIEEVELFVFVFLVPVEGEALGFAYNFQIRS